MTETKRMSGGEAVTQSLLNHGVDTVFGIPGVQLDPLFDAFYGQRNRLRVVHTRHEQGSAFMASGYAQSSGKTGVFAVVPGPGLLNAMAAVSTAAACNLPVLGVTGQIPSHQIGGGLGIAHELRDQLAMSEGVVHWAKRADHPAAAGPMLADAFAHMHGPRPAPAIFEMAPDQFAASAPMAEAPVGVAFEHVIDEDAIERAVALMDAAERPAILVGGGAMDLSEELTALAERWQAPVIVTNSGCGAIDGDHALAHGMLSGQRLWPDLDVVLAVGTRALAPSLSWGGAPSLKMIRIDGDPVQMQKPSRPNVGVVASARDGVNALLAAVAGVASDARKDFLARAEAAREETARDLAALQPQAAYAAAMREVMPKDAILAVDVTQMATFVRYGGFAFHEPRTLLAPGFQATLGYGMPAALGASVAHPDKKVVAICGDGGFMFSVQELATAVHHKIPVVVVVFDNSAYGNVKTIQANQFGGRHIAVDLSNPDFAAMARSYGMIGETAETPEAFKGALDRCLAANAPALIHVRIGEVPSIWKLVKRPPSGVAP